MGLRDLNFAEEMDLQKRIVKQEDDIYTLRDDDLWLDTAEELKQVRSELLQYKKLLEKEQELKATLIGLSMKKNSSGGGIRLRKIVKKGNVDYGQIPELWGLDLDAYRKPSCEYWQVIAENDYN